MLIHDVDTFSQALLNSASTRAQTSTIERLSGKQDKYASSVAKEIVKDLKMATVYPPETIDTIQASELCNIVNELSSAIVEARNKKEGGGLFDDL